MASRGQKEESDDMKWFWFDKNGKLYRTEATTSNAIQYDFKDGVVTPKKTMTVPIRNLLYPRRK